MGRRPKLSDRGPANNMPSPNPRNKAVMMNCASLASETDNSAPISASAGNIISVDIATMDTMKAISTINSVRDGGFV